MDKKQQQIALKVEDRKDISFKLLKNVTIVYLTIAFGIIYGQYKMGYSSFKQFLFLILGLFIFSFVEYAMHRWINHGTNFLPARDHRHHHRYPYDDEYIIFPIWETAFILLPFLLFFCVVLPSLYMSFAALSGFMIGYVIYEWVHICTHFPEGKRKGWIKRASNLHWKHHFQNSRKNYGFTSPFWDLVFRTYEK